MVYLFNTPVHELNDPVEEFVGGKKVLLTYCWNFWHEDTTDWVCNPDSRKQASLNKRIV